MPKRFGVIDIGTLKIKFEIIELSSRRQLTTIHQSSALTCLGVRMNENNNKPLPDNLEKTLEELKRCQKVLVKENVDKLRVVSTHALREMGKEGENIARLIKEKVGFKVEIISQQEEAELFFRAVMSDFKTSKDFTVIDSGGGSVQILSGNKNKLKNSFLLKLGAQYLHDTFSPRHSGQDYPTEEEINRMKKYILDQLAPIPEGSKNPLIIGSSCIIDVFKTIGFSLKPFSYSKTHPYKASIKELDAFLKKITPVPYDERERRYQFSQKYFMWGIDKAFLVVLKLCEKIKSPYVIPSNANINRGLILNLIGNK